jgi:predicted HTH transcriptional regulator
MFIYSKQELKGVALQELFNISRETASRDLAGLIKAGIFENSGSKGAGSYFTLK